MSTHFKEVKRELSKQSGIPIKFIKLKRMKEWKNVWNVWFGCTEISFYWDLGVGVRDGEITQQLIESRTKWFLDRVPTSMHFKRVINNGSVEDMWVYGEDLINNLLRQCKLETILKN